MTSEEELGLGLGRVSPQPVTHVYLAVVCLFLWRAQQQWGLRPHGVAQVSPAPVTSEEGLGLGLGRVSPQPVTHVYLVVVCLFLWRAQQQWAQRPHGVAQLGSAPVTSEEGLAQRDQMYQLREREHERETSGVVM